MEVLRVPLLNANEDELLVTAVFVEEGKRVDKGAMIASVESTKTNMDVEAPVAGFVRRLSIAEDRRVQVGALICVITDTADAPLELDDDADAAGPADGDARATKRAAALAEEHGVDLAEIQARGIIKERDVRRHLERGRKSAASPLAKGDEILVYGAGGHAKVLVDLVRESRRDLRIVGAYDDGDHPPADVLGVPVLGDWAAMEEAGRLGIRRAMLGVGAVTNNAKRVELWERLRAAGFELPNLVHARASVEPSVQMGVGNVVFAGAVIGAAARLGDNTIINSGVVVSHDCVIGSHTHLTPGAILAGGVTVGENTVVGMGVTVYLGVTIGRDVVIANGVHVMKDVPDGALVRSVG